MKLLATALITMALATPALATEEDIDICAKAADVAGQLMTIRQLGYPLVDLMSALDGDLAKKLTLQIYKGPRYITSDARDRAILMFKNEVALACYESGSI